MFKKNKHSTIQEAFEKVGYKLLSPYISAHIRMLYECPKGHRGTVDWVSFQHGHRCAKCYQDTRRLGIDKVREALNKEGYILLSDTYENSATRLECRCPKGHIWKTRWRDFSDGGDRCLWCSHRAPLSTEKVRNMLIVEGYQLLSTEYINTHLPIEVSCPAGHIYKVRWYAFHQGRRCPHCQEYRNEKKLREVLELIYPGKVKQYDNLGFLGLLKVDFSVRDLQLAFEYDGEQHFRPVQFGGIDIERAKGNLRKQKSRDSRKNRLCKKNNYKLIRLTYKDKISRETVICKLAKMEVY
jgi:very-short-patch-repair endonuclease